MNNKDEKVRSVFDSVANRYDIMNDVMSFFIHRFWKDIFVFYCNINKGDKILDLAGGTGDLAKRFFNLVGDNGEIIIGDVNLNMLRVGKKNLSKLFYDNIKYVHLNAENLPFDDNYFDCVSIGFGIRNFTNISIALQNIYRVLKKGGKLMILEFSCPVHDIISSIYDLYSFNVLPKFGKFICNDEYSYKYLVESIRLHPNQNELLQIIKQVGFKECSYKNLFDGIVSIHVGIKY